MGNCWCRWNPAVYRVSSNVKSESPKNPSSSLKDEKSPVKLPSNPEEVEDLRRDSAANPLIVFTYSELKIITGNFRQDNVLGGGGFGSVYKGYISEGLREGTQPLQVAVKVHDGDNSFQGHREWLAEVLFLGQLSHPNLVKLIGYCCEDEHRVLIYEYMSRGSVENHLFSRILLPLSWSIRMKIALGAAKGLAFLHEAEKPVIYRDFKTSNILLDQDYNSKLSDFGLAKDGPVGDKSHVSTRIMGTYGYAAPEYVMTGHLTVRSDVYSFGVVLLELLTGRTETPAPTKEDSNSILPVTSEAPAETPSPEPTSVPEPTSEAPASSSAPAPSSAAPSASPSSSPGYSASKRGLAYNDPKLCGDFDESKIGFAYNWASKRETELPEGLQYVPMMHRPDVATVEEWLADVKTAVEQGSKAVMGFNEPDHAAQANLTPEQACTDWKMYMNPIASAHPDVTIVGPSVTNGAAPMGLDWLSRFQKACPDAIWHAANIHFYDIYDGAAERFKEHVQEAIDTFGKPTWVTEFGLNPGSASADQAAEFLKGSQEWMEQNKDVPAYAYFMAGTGENQLNTATGLSTIGEVYAST